MKDYMMVFIFFIAFSLYGVGCFELGNHAGRSHVVIKPVPIADIDKQCTTWLFKTNLEEAKKRICGEEK